MRNTFQRAALLLIFLLNACGGNEPSVTATPLPSETPVIPPTLTATPTIPLAALILPSNLDPETSNLYQTTVYDLTQSSGYRFQTRDSITEADLTEPGLKIVIALPPDPGIAALAAAAPHRVASI